MEEITYKQFSLGLLAKLRNPYLRTVDVELTNRCNLNCNFCYLGKDKSSELEMSRSKLLEIGKQLRSMNFIIVLFLGGEPLIRKDFESIHRFFYRLGFLINLYTNGTLIDKNIAQLFKDYPLFRLGISIYSASNERYRKITGKSGMFERIVNGINLLKQENINFYLHFLVTKDTAGEVNNMIKMAKYFKSIYTLTTAASVGCLDKSYCKKYRITQEDLNFIKKTSPQAYRLLNVSEEAKRNIRNCPGILHISSTGKIQMCPVLKETPKELKGMKLEEAVSYLSKKRLKLSCLLKERRK